MAGAASAGRCRLLVQAELEHARDVEPVEPEHRAGRLRRRPGRHQTDELRAEHLGAPRGRLRLDPRHELVQPRRLPVLHVHAHLRVPGGGEVVAERTDARIAPAALAHDRRDLARHLRGAAHVHVERDQRPARAHEHAAGRRVEPRRPVGRSDLARVEPPLELLCPATPEEGRPSSLPHLAVEERGQPELRRQPLREQSGRALRARHVGRSDRDDRDDVRGTDPRMHAVVAAQVDPLLRHRDARDQRVLEVLLVADEREDRPVVVGVGVHVEERRVRPERACDRVDHRSVAPLREVRHGLQGQHAAYPTAPP